MGYVTESSWIFHPYYRRLSLYSLCLSVFFLFEFKFNSKMCLPQFTVHSSVPHPVTFPSVSWKKLTAGECTSSHPPQPPSIQCSGSEGVNGKPERLTNHLERGLCWHELIIRICLCYCRRLHWKPCFRVSSGNRGSPRLSHAMLSLLGLLTRRP